MMGNSSQVSYFTLGAYFDTGPLRWLYFLLIMSVYALIVLSNLLLIVVICLNRTLHEPMYFFLCSLLINELYGSTALFPFLLSQILKEFHTVSSSLCFLQIFLIHSYACTEFMTLAVLSYDRYLAICFPLQYNTRMNPRKTAILAALPWLYSFVVILIVVSLSSPLKLCGNIISKVYCDNYSVVKLSCSDTLANNIYGLISSTLTVFGPVVFMSWTYVCILKVCFSTSKQTRQKAVATCTPHLASLLNFCCGSFFEIVQSRFDMSHVHMMLRIFLSLYFLTFTPLFNPLMYGLKLSKIRQLCKTLLLRTINR